MTPKAFHACESRTELFGLAWERSLKPSPAAEAIPATDFISAKRKFTEVCIFASLFAELDAPPTMRHHAETSAAMIADLGLPHDALA